MAAIAFGFETTTDEVLEGIDLTGKTILVTGASTGLGEETSRALASKDARVIMASRDVEKLEAAAARVSESTGNKQIQVLQLDLGNFASIRKAAAEALEMAPRIDVLINNAGVMACPLMRTSEGHEMQFGTNHLGHFLLTGLLEPALEASGDARIVNLSSGGHKFSAVNLDDWNYESGEYDKWQAYGRSKTANALFSVALDKRLAGKGIRAFAVHPGAIMTELSRHLTPDDVKAIREDGPRDSGPMTFKTIPQGAATSVWAATSPSLEGKGGIYLEDCRIAELASTPLSHDGYVPHAVDPSDAEGLWTLSEQIVGQQFSF
ncbi:MAG: SDR family NAD(P)-dependent oxidoreductase [Myxococcota bacterium]|jgi:NAD(P)-dependent dehydrogenase (short-subunit alcohol dehydrogenase family)|nr:SDR family NAD(P)-dependent oxidoreductase [Myxococcota bacterium]